MGVYIKNITKDDLAENGALMWGKRIIFIPPEDIIPVQDHGDLVEKDVVLDALDLMAANNRLHDAYDFVKSCEAVIPAERSEE